MTTIFYVCDPCHDNAPECCGHEDRTDLVVIPETAEYGKTTICMDCYENWSDWRGDEERPELDTLQHPADLTRDAARYQFLRSRDLDEIHQGGVFAGKTPENLALNGEDLDRHVDDAMAAEASSSEPKE